MKKHCFLFNHSKRRSIWFLALLAVASVVWLIVRTGTKPSRINYPCQKAAVANINIFLVAAVMPLVGLKIEFLKNRLLKSKVTTALIVTSLLAIMAVSNFASFQFTSNPVVNYTPVNLNLQSQTADAGSSSNLFFITDASGPQGNMDSAISTLLSSMHSNGLDFFKTSTTPSGLIGANDVIIIKVNAQSAQRGSTNTDLIKSLVKAIVDHPDGFTGEVVIADNGQSSGALYYAESNAYDHSQSMTDVAAVFPGYKVSSYSWFTIANNLVTEYSNDNYQDGYVVNPTPDATTGVKVSYPKFQTAYGTYISFKNGVWNPSTGTYDSTRLKIINLPLFKSHYNYGATSCVKNYMGVGSQTLTGEHDSVGNGGMGTQMVQTRFPTLNILDGIWVNANPFQPGEQPGSSNCGPFTTYDSASYTNVIGASTDPVALEYWFAKHIAMPAALQRGYTYISSIDPDYGPVTQNLVQSYHNYLTASMNQIKNSGRQATMSESDMNVYVTINQQTPTLPFTDYFANLNKWTVVDGNWEPLLGMAQGSGPSEILMYAGSTAWTNYDVSSNMRIVNSGEASIVIRYKDPVDFYWLGLGCWGHEYSISKVVNGVYQEIAYSGLASEVMVGRWYSVSAVAVDNVLQLYVDGANVLEVQDNSLSSGAIGFRSWGGSMQASFVDAQTPKPTPAPSPSPTATPTPTPSPTPTPTPSPTQTPTESPTPTPTPTLSPTPRPSPTLYSSPSPTLTTTPKIIPTPTASPIPIYTSTPNPSLSATPTAPTPGPSELRVQSTGTPLYLYVAAVIVILVISTTVLIIKKKVTTKDDFFEPAKY